MTRVAVTAAAMALCAVAANAQSHMSGKVIAKPDSSPVVGAEVISPAGSHVRTNIDGHFTINLAKGDSLYVRALGYRPSWFAWGSNVMQLEALPTTLETVITTAGQRSMSSNESAASVTVIDRNALDATASVSANQMLRQVPGLQELSSPPSKTGIAIRGLDAARVLVLVDGEPVIGSLIETRDIGRLSTLATERIEVTKGPSSVEFGSDALGGVINLVTAAPTQNFHGELTTRLGEFGRREANGEVSDTRGRLGYRASLGWRQVDAVTAIGAEGTSLDRVYDLRTDLRYALSANTQWRTDVQLSRQRQRWPVGGGYNGFIDNHAAQALSELQSSLLGGLARVRLFAQYSDYEFRQSQFLTPIAGSADSLEQTERMARMLLAFTRPVGAHLFDAGAQASFRAIVAPQKIENDSADDRVFEFFARDRWTHGRVLLTGGARMTDGSLWGNAVTPTVGGTYQVTETWRLRANFARGFRAPSFKEIRYTFANPAAGYVIEGNPDLEPETSSNVDVGASWAPATRVTFDVAGYTTRVKNLIDTRFTSLNSGGYQVFKNLNVARARLDGVEAGARFAFATVEITAGYNYLRARDLETGRILDRRAKHTARLGASRSWAHNIVSDISAHYTGAAPLGDEKQGAMLSLDGQLRAPVMSRLDVSVGVTNALDRRPVNWSPAVRRQIYVGLKAHTA